MFRTLAVSAILAVQAIGVYLVFGRFFTSSLQTEFTISLHDVNIVLACASVSAFGMDALLLAYRMYPYRACMTSSRDMFKQLYVASKRDRESAFGLLEKKMEQRDEDELRRDRPDLFDAILMPHDFGVPEREERRTLSRSDIVRRAENILFVAESSVDMSDELRSELTGLADAAFAEKDVRKAIGFILRAEHQFPEEMREEHPI